MAYQFPYEEEKVMAPEKLKTNRSAWKLILLSFLTFGIYGIFFFLSFSDDLDKVAPKEDRSKTMNYVVVYLISLFTCSIALYIWHYQVAKHIEYGLGKRTIAYDFGTGTFWAWYIFGSLILIGPIVYTCKLCKAMNLLCADYNERPDCT